MLTKDVKIDQSEGISGSRIPEQAFVKNVHRRSFLRSPYSPLLFSLAFPSAAPTARTPGTGYTFSELLIVRQLRLSVLKVSRVLFLLQSIKARRAYVSPWRV